MAETNKARRQRAASDYVREADGGVSYTGAPEDFSQDMAAAVAQDLELGSMPEPTGDLKDEKASTSKKDGPLLEMGVQG